MLSILLALAAATPAKPVGNPGDWILSSDYPSSEIRKAGTGVTAFGVVVGKDGSVRDCTVIASSGSVTLDATACALVRARAKFTPARDANGRKVEGVFQSRVRWELPAGVSAQLPVSPQVLAIAVDIDAKGFVEQCRLIEGNINLAEGQPSPCLRFPVGVRQRAATGQDGKPVAYRMILRQSMAYEPR